MAVNTTQILSQLQKIALEAAASNNTPKSSVKSKPGLFDARLDAVLGRDELRNADNQVQLQQAAELLQLGTMRRSIEQLSDQPVSSQDSAGSISALMPQNSQVALQQVQAYLQNQPSDGATVLSDSGKKQPLPEYEPGPKAAEHVDGGADQTNSSTVSTGSIEQVIARASQRYGVDAGLIRAVIKAESNFNPRAVSHAGAQGLMQLMPATARGLGVNNPFDVEQNVMAGTRFLKGLLDRYNGDLDSALAAYNWGPGNVDRRPDRLPRETREYLAKVKQYYIG